MKYSKLERQKERGKYFYSVMQEKRRMPITLINKEGLEIPFNSRQKAGAFLALKYGCTLEHCTLLLRKTGAFKDYTIKK